MDTRIKVSLGDWRGVNKEREWSRTMEIVKRIGVTKGRKYFKDMFQRKRKKPWFYEWEEERGSITMVNRLRANHMNVKESLHRKGYIDEIDCDCGAGVKSIQHLVFMCGRHADMRNSLYKALEEEKIPYPYYMEDWLRNTRIIPFKEV